MIREIMNNEKIITSSIEDKLILITQKHQHSTLGKKHTQKQQRQHKQEQHKNNINKNNGIHQSLFRVVYYIKS